MIDLPLAGDRDEVLAQPTRARLFALLGELHRPASTAELAGLIGRHPNGVRTHLDRLERAGLVCRSKATPPRGRPFDLWAVAPGARAGARAPTAYMDLGRWLARALASRSGTGVRAIEKTGHQIGRELASADTQPSPDAFETALIELGFEPAVSGGDRDRLAIQLRNCPYRAAVRENQVAICALHKGITRGLLDVLHPRARLESFTPHDPDQAGCEIAVGNLAATASRGR